MCPKITILFTAETVQRPPSEIMTFEDMADQNLSKYGLDGSPTAVEKMFAPPEVEKQVYFDGDAKEKTKQLFDVLVNKKVI